MPVYLKKLREGEVGGVEMEDPKSGGGSHHSSSDNVGNKSTISKIVAGKTFLQYLNCFNCHVKLTEEIQLGEAIYLNIGLEKDISLVLLLLNIVTFIS